MQPTEAHPRTRTPLRARGRIITAAVAALAFGVGAMSAASAAQTAPVAVARVSGWGPSVNPGGPGFANQTIRERLHVSAGGTAVRLRLSNLHGAATLAVGHVDLAVQAGGGTAVSGTHHRVTFGGAGSVSIPAGGERISDPVSITATFGENLLASVYVPGSTGPSTWHPGATTATYVSRAGDHAADDGAGNYPTTISSWFFLDGLDLAGSTAAGTLVAFGDSITDGYRSTVGADRRYPDDLARRLAAVAGGPKLGVVNAGIGGNRVLGNAGNTYGESALSRFAHDALGETGVKDVIFLEGINDITSGSAQSSAQLISAYQTLISQAHRAGVSIYGGTITPFGGSRGYTSARERLREEVNNWIRTSRAFDGVVDFDAALRDPSAPIRMRTLYDSGDHLHPNDAGYQAMAGAVNLNLLAY